MSEFVMVKRELLDQWAERFSKAQIFKESSEVRAVLAQEAVPDGWKLVPIEPTEAMLNVLHDRVLISVNSRKQEASILNDKAWWKAVVDSAPTCLDKVKEMNQ